MSLMQPPTLNPPSPPAGPDRRPSHWACGGVLLAILGLGACQPDHLSMSLSNLADPGDPLYDLVDTYLVGEKDYPQVTALIYCRDSADTDCLVRIEAVEPVAAGASSSLILHLATLGQEFPGDASNEPLESGGWNADPAVFAATEEVGQDDPVRRYDFDCRHESGEIHLDTAPLPNHPLSGRFDLVLTCQEQMSPLESSPIRVTGTFEVELKRAPYAL